MNLYFRLLWLFVWRLRHITQIGFLDTSRMAYRVWPSDCDINLHLTNARYPALMDIGRTYMLAEMQQLKPLLKLKWLPVVNASEFTFVKDIKPLQKFWLETRVLGWDDKYFYIEQRFVSDRGLHAIANVRGLFMCKRRKITTEELIAQVGFSGEAPMLPPSVQEWKAMLQRKKDENIV
ncbi:thioesterase family protein [Shewanella avicenniae]|uniref:Thioesterase family protein n=1 Tax=Shewanella avicenniae TaxID=2814294 RepID=A0ABX7QSC8_9GAMM|nr:thioesterase family protein [Shewanella avicenniae]QSX33591.1 thioesterase family protein [Shewanella avicenniae]